MPRRRRHLDDHGDDQHKKPVAKAQQKRPQQVARQAAPVQLIAAEAAREGGLGGQAEMLANPQLMTAQRASFAGQIAQAQGNRHLGQVLSAIGLKEQTIGGQGHFIQRQDTPAAHPTIRYGSRGTSVEEAQTKLNAAGANPPLAVDGIFGPLTRAAVVEFQTAHNLSPDGIVGPLTWGALDQTGPEPPGPGPEPPTERWSAADVTRLAAQTSDTGPINVYQASRAELRVLGLPDSEFSALRSLLEQAGSDMEWAFLLKAAAAQRSISDITAFAERIRGMSERWLMRNLMVVDLANDLTPGEADPEERGIMQQYGNSCGPTSVQLIHAQADPIYALELRSAGPIDQAPDNAVSNPETIANQQLANEQAAMLNAHVATGGNAPTNRTNPAGGAWVETDMNALSAATGVTYTTQIIGAGITQEDAINTLKTGLASGVQVPIIVGGGLGAKNTSHYVMVLIASGNRFLIHDVATGDTVWRNEDEFRSNTLHLPSLWNFFVAIDVPTLTPPPLPQPPAPTGG
jgi:hypothetical protein